MLKSEHRTESRLPAYCGLRTSPSSLCRCQRSHSSANQHSSGRQELLCCGTETMEQSTRNTATTRHQTLVFQTTFKDFSA